MFDLRVTGRDEAIVLVKAGWPTRIVSLTSDEHLYHGPDHLHIQVSDVAFVSPKVLSPTPEHLHAALRFTVDLTDADRLLVHCHMGVSRSTAIAIGILINHGMSYLQAFEQVAKVRGILTPNELFIRHIDDHFGLDGQLIAHAALHRKTSIGEMLIVDAPSQAEIDDMKRLLAAFRL